MYAGATTEAMPMPMPPSRRQATRSQTMGVGPNTRPEPIEETRKRIAPMSMTGTRPKRSASRPAISAPIAQPSRALATAKPMSEESRWK